MNKFLLGIVISTAITLTVFAAIAVDALGLLIFGLVVVGLLIIGLSAIGVNLFSRYTDASHKMQSLKYAHAERMADRGLLPTGRGHIDYKPLQLQQPEDIPVDTSGLTDSTVSPFKPDAVELVALSKQVMGQDATQIAPYYKARKNDYFRDVAVWLRAVQWLLVNNWATEKRSGGKKLGTYCMSGTVSQLYDRIRTA